MVPKEEATVAEIKIRQLSAGASQHQLRNYNERLILTLIQRHGALAGSDIARHAGLSPQTVSVILRRLENENLVERGDPQRGRVGKPSVPIGLAARGVLSYGLKIGRRSAELILIDFLGGIVAERRTTYRYPTPEGVFGFIEGALAEIAAEIPPDHRSRVAGLGIASPHELWNWHEAVGAPAEEMAAWRSVDFAERIAAFSELPVLVENDATAACRAEQVYGHGKAFQDYAYFFLGYFIGGGVVLNHSVFEGRHGNAGAFGSLPLPGRNGVCQLIDTASISLLERDLAAAGLDPSALWRQPLDWRGFDDRLDAWIDSVAEQLAMASLTVCAVIDFEAVVIDGALPPDVRRRLVAATRRELDRLDGRGLVMPAVAEGVIGANARALGAACGPIFSQYLLDTHTGLAAPG